MTDPRLATVETRRAICVKNHDPKPWETSYMAASPTARWAGPTTLSPRPEFCQKPSHYSDDYRQMKRTTRGWRFK